MDTFTMGLFRSMTIEDFKAVSMNVMHSSMETTDEVYSRLGIDEINSRINNLGKQTEQSQDNIEEGVRRYLVFLLSQKSGK